MNNLSTQKRVLIATLLSFVFFIVYDYFFIPKTLPNEQNQTVQAQTSVSNSAPVSQNGSLTPKTSSTNSDKTLVVVKAKDYEAHIDELGRISKFYLNEEKYKTEDGERTQLTAMSPLPLELRFSDTTINNQAFNVNYSADVNEISVDGTSRSVNLTQNLDGLTITKKITFRPDGSYDVDVDLSREVEYFVTPGFRPNVSVDSYTVHGVLLRHADEKLTILEDDDLDGGESFSDVNIAAASDRYYTTLLYSFDKPLNVVTSVDPQNNAIAFIKQNGNFKGSGYIGAKEYRALKAIDIRLTDVVEYGWFSFIAKPMFAFLSFLYSHIGNWGWAIVVLTLVIRIVLFPLTYKGMLSMNKLKELSPKLKELQAKYKGDPQKLNAHMMELYKKHGANPMGGCLPILLQIPVFFAIYRVLLNAIELKGAEWILWIHDLSVMDPYFILPILMGVTMFLQQRLTPTTFSDPMQEKIMKFLPLIFTFFFVTFPAGLTLYWFINNVCSVIQQIFVNKLFAKQKKAEVKA
ncbi:membrane protein insertase YidC [Campylobacter sp. 7477a]|uniref:membrane protein insertase YidC n=1 Tax=Campylobacter sp. 7477a TaxID=2735741 RepID=UPI0030148DC6|nr:membrane protein insertase YidC [Campylobacter sp. 7477a]